MPPTASLGAPVIDAVGVRKTYRRRGKPPKADPLQAINAQTFEVMSAVDGAVVAPIAGTFTSTGTLTGESSGTTGTIASAHARTAASRPAPTTTSPSPTQRVNSWLASRLFCVATRKTTFRTMTVSLT